MKSPLDFDSEDSLFPLRGNNNQPIPRRSRPGEKEEHDPRRSHRQHDPDTGPGRGAPCSPSFSCSPPGPPRASAPRRAPQPSFRPREPLPAVDGQAALSGSISAFVSSGAQRLASTGLRSSTVTFVGAVISIPIGVPFAVKSIIMPGSIFTVRWLLSSGGRGRYKYAAIGCP